MFPWKILSSSSSAHLKNWAVEVNLLFTWNFVKFPEKNLIHSFCTTCSFFSDYTKEKFNQKSLFYIIIVLIQKENKKQLEKIITANIWYKLFQWVINYQVKKSDKYTKFISTFVTNKIKFWETINLIVFGARNSDKVIKTETWTKRRKLPL